jgi:hypothetical protein
VSRVEYDYPMQRPRHGQCPRESKDARVLQENHATLLLALLLGLTAWWWPGAAIASDNPEAPASPPRIEWEAPAGCPDAAQVRDGVARLVGASAARGPSARLVARGMVTPTASGHFALQVYVETSGGSETKSFEAASCATLAEAYSLIVAFTLDPSAGTGPRMEGTIASAPPSEATATAAARRGLAAAERGQITATHAGAGPLAALGAGLLPFPAYGVGARFALEHGVRWELSGLYWPGQQSSAEVALLPTAGARVRLVSVQPGACVLLAHGKVGVCAGVALGVMQAVGVGVSHPENGTSWWTAPTVGLELRAALGDVVALRFRAEVGVPVFRPRFVLQDVGSAASVDGYRPAAFFASLSVQPEIRFFSTDSTPARHDYR